MGVTPRIESKREETDRSLISSPIGFGNYSISEVDPQATVRFHPSLTSSFEVKKPSTSSGLRKVYTRSGNNSNIRKNTKSLLHEKYIKVLEEGELNNRNM